MNATLDYLLDANAGRYTLPLGKFFVPNPTFFHHMRTFSGKVIYDVGAGEGHIAATLLKQGHKAIALDTNARKCGKHPVIMTNGTTFKYQAGSVVMLCRPSHGYFCEPAIDRAAACKVAHVIYVGLEKNLADDLCEYAGRAKLVASHVGSDGESLWSITI